MTKRTSKKPASDKPVPGETKAPGGKHTHDDVITALRALSLAGARDVAFNILNSIGGTKSVRMLDPVHYDAVTEAAEASLAFISDPAEYSDVGAAESENLGSLYFHLSAAIAILGADDTLSDVALGRFSSYTFTSDEFRKALLTSGRSVALPHVEAVEVLIAEASFVADRIKNYISAAHSYLRLNDSHYDDRSRVEAAYRLRIARDLVAVAIEGAARTKAA